MKKMIIFKNIFKDLNSLKIYEKIFIAIAGIFLVFLGLFNFNELKFFWQLDLEVWKKVLQGLSGVTAFTGILCVFMVGKGKMSNYFWGILNVTIYGFYAFSVAYTGDALLNLFFFLPFQFVGILSWKNHLKKETVKPRKFTGLDFLTFAFLAIGLSLAFYFLIPIIDEFLNINILGNGEYEGYPFDEKMLPHSFDALTNRFSIAAQILMLWRFKNQWYLWILVNILQIAMYSGINGWGFDLPMIIMWGCFLINAVYSLGNWIKLENQKKEKKDFTWDYRVLIWLKKLFQKKKS